MLFFAARVPLLKSQQLEGFQKRKIREEWASQIYGLVPDFYISDLEWSVDFLSFVVDLSYFTKRGGDPVVRSQGEFVYRTLQSKVKETLGDFVVRNSFIEAWISLWCPDLDSLEAIPSWVDPFFSDRHLRQSVSSSLEDLRSLGISSVSDFYEELLLRPGGYVVRFGKWVLDFKDRFGSKDCFIWPKYKPSLHSFYSINLQDWEQTSDRASILFWIRKWCVEVVARVKKVRAGVGIIKASLSLEQDAGPGIVKELCLLNVDLFYPSLDDRLLFKYFEAQLSVFERKTESMRSESDFFERPIVALHGDWEERSLPRDESAFEIGGFTEEQKQKKLQNKLIDFVSQIQIHYPLESVYKLSLENRRMPEDQVIEVSGASLLGSMIGTSLDAGLTSKESFSGKYRDRPLRLFKKPVEILREGFFLSINEHLFRIVKLEQKEILRKDWWKSQAEYREESVVGIGDRHYYRVLLRKHTQRGLDSSKYYTYWIFQDQNSKKLYWHGVFE